MHKLIMCAEQRPGRDKPLMDISYYYLGGVGYVTGGL